MQKLFEKDGIDHSTGQNGDDGHRLYDRIGLCEHIVACHLLDQPVLCRRIDRTLCRKHEGHRKRKPEPAHGIGKEDQRRDPYCSRRCILHHFDLGILIRDKPCGREEEDEGQKDQCVDDRGQHDQLRAFISFEDRILQDDLVSKIGHRIEKNDQYVRNETGDLKQCFHASSSLC